MLRRFSQHSYVAFGGGSSLATFATTQKRLVEVDPLEREREKELRQQVMQKYRGMQIPEMTNFQYGHFSTGGIQAAAAQQAMRSQGFFGMPGSSGGTSGSTNATSGESTQNVGGGSNFGGFGGNFGDGASNVQVPGFFKVDWLMLFTGAALMYISGKILYNQMTRGVDDLDFPLWTASLQVQAQHLLFCVQYGEKEREEMKREFQSVRQTNPFADFFQWVRSRHPEFCSGNRNSADMSVSALIGALSSTNSRELMALATALRQSLGHRGGDPLGRVDDFISKLYSNGAMLGGMGGAGGMAGLGGGRSPVPAYAPPSPTPTHAYTTPQDQEDVGGHSTNPFEHVSGEGKSM